MNRYLTYLFFGVLLAAPAGDASGQASGNATADIEVLGTLTVSKLQDIQFGQVEAGAGLVTLDPQTGTTGVSTGTESQGKFQISTTDGTQTDFQATFSSSVTMNEASSPNSITFDPIVYGYDQNQVNNSAPYTSGTSATFNNGNYYFWIGGDIDVGAGQASGSYVGTFTLSVSYLTN